MGSMGGMGAATRSEFPFEEPIPSSGFGCAVLNPAPETWVSTTRDKSKM